jgi:hypothetical protein
MRMTKIRRTEGAQSLDDRDRLVLAARRSLHGHIGRRFGRSFLGRRRFRSLPTALLVFLFVTFRSVGGI